MGSVESTMYILVLDKSSSMKTRSKWVDLIAESKRFLGLIENDPILKSNTKITIITYNDDITINCENKVPEVTLIDNLELNGGGTDFEKPLIKVKEIVAKYLTNFHTFHCCFLSDGQAQFPKNAINSILYS
jgi:Mg-chelatase subunit ChlD